VCSKLDHNSALAHEEFCAIADPSLETVSVEFLPGSRKRAVLEVHVMGCSIKSLVDSGADSCYLREDILHKLRGFGHFSVDTESRSSAITANLGSMDVIGRVALEVMIGSDQTRRGTSFRVEFSIVKQLSHEMILGWEQFLHPNGGIIDARTNNLHLLKPARGSNNLAYVMTEVRLAPFSETVVSVVIKSTDTSDSLLILPYHPLLEHAGVSVRPGIHNGKLCDQNMDSSLILANLTSSPVVLPACTIVALTQPCVCLEVQPKTDPNEARDKRQERRSYRAERERAQKLNNMHTTPKNCKTNASHVNGEATKQTLLTINGKLVKIVNELLTESQHHAINDLINVEFVDLFATSSKPSQVLNVKHSIDTGSAKPVNRAPYRTGPKEREIIQVQVESMLSDNIIRKSKSPWASGIVLVRKKDGSVRFCFVWTIGSSTR
jgi:hypothetical protein